VQEELHGPVLSRYALGRRPRVAAALRGSSRRAAPPAREAWGRDTTGMEVYWRGKMCECGASSTSRPNWARKEGDGVAADGGDDDSHALPKLRRTPRGAKTVREQATATATLLLQSRGSTNDGIVRIVLDGPPQDRTPRRSPPPRHGVVWARWSSTPLQEARNRLTTMIHFFLLEMMWLRLSM